MTDQSWSGDAAAIPEPRAGQRAGATPPQVAFPPVLNGLDYLQSVVEHLSGHPSPRGLKYAVLHLQAGTEVLLKARLQLEHWTLVVQDLPTELRKTKKGPLRGRIASGAFASCSTDEALTRLREVVGLDLDAKHLAAVAKLAETRNALQHYGLTQSAPAVEAQAATVLDFLLVFLHEHLLPHLNSREQVQVEEAMDDVRHRLGGITKLMATRMNGLKKALEPHTDITVDCPECGMPALLAGEPLWCRFCYRTWPDAESAADDYLYSEMARRASLDPLDNEKASVYHCPACEVPTVIDIERHDWSMYLCLGCAATFDTLIWCKGGCGGLIDPARSDFDVCPACSARLLGRR